MISAGRLTIRQHIGPREGDKIVLVQTHRNGSAAVVGEIELDADEIEDAIYVLTRARARATRKNHQVKKINQEPNLYEDPAPLERLASRVLEVLEKERRDTEDPLSQSFYNKLSRWHMKPWRSP